MSEDDAIVTAPQTGCWRVITEHYEKCLRQHGATPAGVDWPNGPDLAARFGVMPELLTEAGERPELLDVGRGSGLMLDYLAATDAINRVAYRGIDLSNDMIRMAQSHWPEHAFASRDIVAEPLPDQSVDGVIMNGVLTERISLGVETMTQMAQSLVAAAYRVARVGIAFNVVNAHVDWQRDDLFHWPFDDLASFLKREVSRHYCAARRLRTLPIHLRGPAPSQAPGQLPGGKLTGEVTQRVSSGTRGMFRSSHASQTRFSIALRPYRPDACGLLDWCKRTREENSCRSAS